MSFGVSAIGKVGSVNIDGPGAGNNYLVSVDVTASDDTYRETTTINLQIPINLLTPATFNGTVLDAVKDWADNLHGWNLPKSRIYMQTFDRGPLI